MRVQIFKRDSIIKPWPRCYYCSSVESGAAGCRQPDPIRVMLLVRCTRSANTAICFINDCIR